MANKHFYERTKTVFFVLITYYHGEFTTGIWLKLKHSVKIISPLEQWWCKLLFSVVVLQTSIWEPQRYIALSGWWVLFPSTSPPFYVSTNKRLFQQLLQTFELPFFFPGLWLLTWFAGPTLSTPGISTILWFWNRYLTHGICWFSFLLPLRRLLFYYDYFFHLFCPQEIWLQGDGQHNF